MTDNGGTKDIILCEYTVEASTEASTPEELSEAIRHILLSMGPDELPCLLCGIHTDGRGVYVPDNSLTYGATSTQELRMAVFPLCPKCKEGEDENGNENVQKVLIEITNREETVH